MLENLKAKSLQSSFTAALLARIANSIRERCSDLTRIYVFGSAARNEMTDLSDVDIIVTVPSHEHVKPTRKALAALTLEVEWPLDVLIYSDADFDQKSQIGGVCFDAFHEGHQI